MLPKVLAGYTSSPMQRFVLAPRPKSDQKLFPVGPGSQVWTRFRRDNFGGKSSVPSLQGTHQRINAQKWGNVGETENIFIWQWCVFAELVTGWWLFQNGGGVRRQAGTAGTIFWDFFTILAQDLDPMRGGWKRPYIFLAIIPLSYKCLWVSNHHHHNYDDDEHRYDQIDTLL